MRSAGPGGGGATTSLPMRRMLQEASQNFFASYTKQVCFRTDFKKNIGKLREGLTTNIGDGNMRNIRTQCLIFNI
jgi:hypothetical protein